jgi:glycosyltransferase involved in cell wall biosynthesis
MPGPDVSVVIPTRDRPHFARRALAVALSQRDVDVEVVIVDDSEHGDLAAQLGVTDPRVRIVHNDPPHSSAYARNRGTMEACAPYVAFLDDDDLWAPHRLRALLDALERRPGARWAYGSLVHLDGDLRRIVAPIKWAVPAERVRDALSATNVVGTPSNVIADTALVRSLGCFDPDVLPLEDWDMWLRLAAAAPIAVVDEPLTAYVQHGSMGTVKVAKLMPRQIARLRDKSARAGIDWDPDLDRTWIPRWEALAYRQSGQRLRAARTYGRLAVRYRNGSDVVRAAGALLGDDFMTWVAERRRPAIAAPAWIGALRTALAAAGALGVE